MSRITFLLILISGYAYAQPVFINEGFADNFRAWPQGSGTNYTLRIEGGKYIITTTQEGSGRVIRIHPYFDKRKDFSLEATFVQKSGSVNNGIGLVWGENPSGKNYEFLITSNGYYKIRGAEKAKQNDEWIKYKKINPLGKSNHLRIVQKNAVWSYYINGKKVRDIEVQKLHGTSIGFTNYTNMVLEVDDFIFKHDVKINLPDKMTTGLVKENLGNKVNTPYGDVSPKIATDGRAIYFAVRDDPATQTKPDEETSDIWMTTSEDGVNWNKSYKLGPDINTSRVNNLAAISADNNMMLFCKTEGFQIRRKTATGWSEPEWLNVKFKNEAKHMEGTLSADGKAILFTVKLPDNVAYDPKQKSEDKDVYVTVQDKNGTWSKPINLGKKINTEADEMSPFLAADGRTLYFASQGHPGYGGMDIFMSKRKGKGWTDWTEPVNLGPEINTASFDAYYTIPASADYAYMSSAANESGRSDIVRIKLPQAIKPDPVLLVLGHTLNAKTKAPIKADIIFEDLSTNEEAGVAISDPATGSYRVTLADGKHYGIRAQAKGFLSVNENMELAAIAEYTEVKKDLYLMPIEEGESILLNNVFFEQGRPILKPQSFPELDRLAQILEENPSIKIEIQGHTDNVGNRLALQELSENRVMAVREYLIGKGIKKDRITGKGFGPNRPIAPNDTEENRQRNRRVEFQITKK
ncbi:MAG: OmpA family protein [Cyclobacteriaceae bacterium]|nr:OmpA family protein [Cyclobacteriaceae bacterium]